MMCAHMILDASIDADVHLVTDRFEIGMYGETPGIIDMAEWPIANPDWLSKTGFVHPNEGDTAIRSSWLKKSMAISLAGRGAKFHTGTRTTEVDMETKTAILSYPGAKTETKIKFDHIVTPTEEADRVWRGAVTNEPPTWEAITGRRPDRTHEVWWEGVGGPLNPLQVMEWKGQDPRLALREANTLAVTKLGNIEK